MDTYRDLVNAILSPVIMHHLFMPRISEVSFLEGGATESPARMTENDRIAKTN